MNRHRLVVIPQHFGSLVFDRRTSRYMPFDREATGLLLATRDETWDGVVASSTDAAQRTRRADFFEYLMARGFFDGGGYLNAEVLEVDAPPDHLLGPLAVHVEVIGACNLTCAHCFADPLPRQRGLLTLDELDGLFADLASIGALRLGLTGGEPLMRPELLGILDSATAHGLHPCLTTNALLLDERIARELGRRELVWLNVSLDGATAQSNDAIRGPGTFERVLEKLAMLREHARFTLAFTITRGNAEEVDACARLAREVGAFNAVFRPLYPVGAARHRPDLMPTFSQYQDALVQLGTSVKPDADLRGIDPFGPYTRHEARVFANRGCGAANSVASVSARGDVSPCSFLGNAHLERPDHPDNIRVRPFSEIWAHSNHFRWMRSLSAPGERGVFQGGCRARSEVMAGDSNAPDPWHTEWVTSGTSHSPSRNLEIEP